MKISSQNKNTLFDFQAEKMLELAVKTGYTLFSGVRSAGQLFFLLLEIFGQLPDNAPHEPFGMAFLLRPREKRNLLFQIIPSCREFDE